MIRQKHLLAKLGLIGLALLSFFSSARGQLEANSEWVRYVDQLKADPSYKSVSAVLKDADDLFERELSNAKADPTRTAQVMLNLFSVRKAAFQILERSARYPSFSDQNHARTIEKFEGIAKSIRKLLVELIAKLESAPALETSELARAKLDYAWFIASYFPVSSGRESLESRIRRLRSSQILQLESLSILRRISSKDDVQLLVNIFVLAESYVSTGDFEYALPLYDEFIASLSKKFDASSSSIRPAVEKKNAILNMINEVFRTGLGPDNINASVDHSGNGLLPLTGRLVRFDYDGVEEKIGRVRLNITTGVVKAVNPSSVQGRALEGKRVAVASAVQNAKASRGIPVVITIDTTGHVIKATSLIEDEEFKMTAEQNVRSWIFRPFILNGKVGQLTGVVYFWM